MTHTNTKLLMTISSVLLGITGLALSFLPKEIAGILGIHESAIIILQVLGAGYFGFGIMNWMAKANLIGGIYSKPVAAGNFSHFLMGGLALGKVAMRDTGKGYLLMAAAVYLAFGLLFGFVFFNNPVLVNKTA